jgi:hypothetical protein
VVRVDPEDRSISLPRRKPEDTAEGCRALAADDRERAATANNGHVRGTFERSAEAWSARARLLERAKDNFHAWAEANALATVEQRSNGAKVNG